MDIITLIETIESRINSYWNFYTVVIFANAGWVFSQYGKLSVITAILLSFGLVLFFVANLSSQKSALECLSVAREELKVLQEKCRYQLLLKHYSTETILYRYSGTFVLHITVDILLIVVVFMATE
ncbi:hypothetical protein [Zooshikella ganghwensis]|uniref:Uncharacterized protein n=1 Tax=Zooshikella ganghwensis TaxID=202772 RepID=A0A4P9VMC9_9GAMM|nr:hypothetical protein [Zooshikella ganghwensis]RDH43527.1 hypothetical protein B9G39_08775 [Zooshikella ganghwensis]